MPISLKAADTADKQAELTEEFVRRTIEFVLADKPTKEELHSFKVALARELHAKKTPTDIDILMSAPEELLDQVRPYLQTKPVRSLSGVCPVAVMSEPRRCPHGKCTYCPGGLGSAFGDTPQSYTGHEPSTMRGKRNEWDSYRIVFNRLEHYVATGHHPDKCDVIIMGGTFPSYDEEYRVNFVKGIFAALNDFSQLFYPEGVLDIKSFKDFFEIPGNVKDKQRSERIKEKVLALEAEAMQKPLHEHMDANQTAVCRCIGLTQETKPDCALLSHGNDMLELGTTRVEVGVQTIFDDVLRATNRGHGIAETIESFAVLKDLGFKINAHMMLGQPGMDVARDEASLRGLFDDADFRPDMVKIYPTLVMQGTALHYQWKQGQYKEMEFDDCVKLIGDFFSYVPRYVRVMRVQRDIPSTIVDGGVKRTNLRQYVDKYIAEHGIESQEIRAREIKDIQITSPELRVQEYEASGGKEYFISIDDKDADKIIGFVRLRFPGQCLRSEITPTTAIIRELHVYGQALPLGENVQGKAQHKGFGRQLVEKAEAIAKEHAKDKMLVISGVGVRQYYGKAGYSLEGPYMSKKL